MTCDGNVCVLVATKGGKMLEEAHACRVLLIGVFNNAFPL